MSFRNVASFAIIFLGVAAFGCTSAMGSNKKISVEVVGGVEFRSFKDERMFSRRYDFDFAKSRKIDSFVSWVESQGFEVKKSLVPIITTSLAPPPDQCNSTCSGYTFFDMAASRPQDGKIVKYYIVVDNDEIVVVEDQSSFPIP